MPPSASVTFWAYSNPGNPDQAAVHVGYVQKTLSAATTLHPLIYPLNARDANKIAADPLGVAHGGFLNAEEPPGHFALGQGFTIKPYMNYSMTATSARIVWNTLVAYGWRTTEEA